VKEVRAPANDVGFALALEAEALAQMRAADSRFEDRKFPTLGVAAIEQVHRPPPPIARGGDNDAQTRGHRVTGRL
jgi:hypothetical protein